MNAVRGQSDADGDQLTSTDYSSGVDATDYGYDALNRQASETVPGSNITVTGGPPGTETIDYSSSVPLDPMVNSWVVVSGISPSGYDGTFQVTESTSTSIQACEATNLAGYSSGGSILSSSFTQYYANGNTQYSWDGSGTETGTTYYPGNQQAVVTTSGRALGCCEVASQTQYWRLVRGTDTGSLINYCYSNGAPVTDGSTWCPGKANVNIIPKKRINGNSYLSVNFHWEMLDYAPFWLDLHFGPGNFFEWNSQRTQRPTGADAILSIDPFGGGTTYNPWPCSGVETPTIR